MHVENNPDFKSIWQLAHDWAGEKSDQTDSAAISSGLRLAIDRLIRAIGSKEISARWKGHRIFFDDSFLSIIFDFRHTIKFYRWLMHNKFSKDYLDNLYVKRNEVITWCEKVALLAPPPCWTQNQITATGQTVETEDENKNWHDEMTDRRRKITGCLELARKLWKENPNHSYDQIYNHSIMQKYGNPSVFSKDSFQEWAKEYAPELARKGGRRKKSMG
ncbi:hypothetical protein C8R34_12251 [Nitrosomonas sp. Nm84]|uniref:hypothetical protein n=1 Tax=Nitrosomonas sp. Nm84 TaxID=200124 RepID=UPI000D894AD5|nr:hypothetical protein [Nitrosomonas sp. Nm84]PXW85017.1 hypothetical protein C8R34_12251 [Nitrosomonas sp. Nm84]